MKEDPNFPTEYLPTAKFEPKMLKMRKKEGENPIHVTMLWTTKLECGHADVLFLNEFLNLKGRDCHVNTGVHGDVDDDGEFYFRWDKVSEDFYRQDFVNADTTTNNVSLHEIK